jgi:hypothetical protein
MSHPTFQELRDGDTYRLADGRHVKVIAPFIPGAPLFARLAEGDGVHCSTRELFRLPRWRVGLRFNDGGDGLAYITADDEDAATEIALRMLDVLRVTTITQEAS